MIERAGIGVGRGAGEHAAQEALAGYPQQKRTAGHHASEEDAWPPRHQRAESDDERGDGEHPRRSVCR